MLYADLTILFVIFHSGVVLFNIFFCENHYILVSFTAVLNTDNKTASAAWTPKNQNIGNISTPQGGWRRFVDAAHDIRIMVIL